MYGFLLYNLKAGACLAVFYVFYKLLLSRETLHRFNRMLLIGIMLLSFALPLCVVTIRREADVDPAVLQSVSASGTAGRYATTESGCAGPGDGGRIAGLLFAAGIAAALLHCCGAILSVVRVIRRSERTPLGGRFVLARYPGEIAPFSWMRYVVISRRDYAENGETIIVHERAHLRLGHSCDLLLTDVLGAVQWFNPAMWLLRRELRAIHEYEADEAVIRSGVDAKTYQLLLIGKAAGGRWCSVADSFNHSKLKDRITMMLRKRSSRWSAARALFVVPLTCAALGAFAETVYVLPKNKDTKKNGTVYTVIVTNDSNAGIGIDGRSCVVVDGRPVEGFDFDRFRAEYSYWNMNVCAKGDRNYARRCRSYGVKPRKFDRLVEIVTRPEAVELSAEEGACVFRIGGDSGTTGVKIMTSDGRSSSSGEKQPLILVDGRERTTFGEIDPETIECIDVLKDREVEQYGEKGKNGVIRITTKAANEEVTGGAIRSGDGEASRQADLSALGRLKEADWSQLERLGELKELDFSGLERLGEPDWSGLEKLDKMDWSGLERLKEADWSRLEKLGELKELDFSGLEKLGEPDWSGLEKLDKMDWSGLEQLGRSGELNRSAMEKLGSDGQAIVINGDRISVRPLTPREQKIVRNAASQAAVARQQAEASRRQVKAQTALAREQAEEARRQAASARSRADR